MIVRELVQYAEDALGGPLPNGISGVSLVNQVGRFIEGMRRWRYLSRSTKAIAFRAPVTSTSVTYDSDAPLGPRLTSTDFSGYTFVPGDTAATVFGGSSSGTYAITGKPSDNVVTIDSDLSGSFPLDSATFDTARVSLPDDFGRLEKVFGVNSFTRSAFPASTVELMHLDTYALTQNNFVTGYTLEWNQATSTSAPVPTLKVWPQPDSADFEALAAIYYRKWPELSGDADTVPIPDYMELLFITAMRAIAMGYDGGSTLDAALAQIRAGDVWQAAVREDGAGQRLAGPVMFRAVRGDSTDGQDPLAGVRTEALFDSP